MRAIGYHGTSVGAARRILSSGFRSSRNTYDWLGDGIYFFQDAPLRAAEWARARFGADAAVVGAEIDLDGCIDLLDIEWENVIVSGYRKYVRRAARSGVPIPRQTSGAHRLDRAVLNHVAELVSTGGMTVRSLRAVFGEGDSMYPGSALLRRSHVQIAVRDAGAIVSTWMRK